MEAGRVRAIPGRVDRNTAESLVRHVLPDEELDRIHAYVLDDCGYGTDSFGTAPEGLLLAYAVGYWFHEHYFRVVSEGHEHIPDEGAGVVTGNHSGVLPFDGMMIATDVFRRAEPPRLVRYMVDYFAYRIPFLGTFFRKLGQIPGTRGNFDGLVREGHLVGVFPEGADALGKPADRRYELFPFSHGHVELAARHRVPVVPFGLVGAEEQQTMIRDVKPLARLLKLPFFPITTTFPLLGPFGLLPKPVRYYIHYGEPIVVDPLVLESVDARQREVDRVRTRVAALVEDGLRHREQSDGGMPP